MICRRGVEVIIRIHASEVYVDDCEGIVIDLTTGRHPIVSLDAGIDWQDGDLFTILILGRETLKETDNQSEAVFK